MKCMSNESHSSTPEKEIQNIFFLKYISDKITFLPSSFVLFTG